MNSKVISNNGNTFSTSKNNEKSSYSKNENIKNQFILGIKKISEINKINHNSKNLNNNKDLHINTKSNDKDNYSGNIILTNNSNHSPNVNNVNNINSFNKNNKNGNRYHLV